MKRERARAQGAVLRASETAASERERGRAWAQLTSYDRRPPMRTCGPSKWCAAVCVCVCVRACVCVRVLG